MSAAFATGLLFIHANSLHPLHRKSLKVSYKFFYSRNTNEHESGKLLRNAFEPTRDADIARFYRRGSRLVGLRPLASQAHSIGAPASETPNPRTRKRVRAVPEAGAPVHAREHYRNKSTRTASAPFQGLQAMLQSGFRRSIIHSSGMKTKANGQSRRVELGRHIVADPKICGGQPTFKGTRIMVWIVLEQLEDGLTWGEIEREWDGRVTEEAIAEAIAIADFVVKHEPFRGFHVGARRKRARRPAAVTA